MGYSQPTTALSQPVATALSQPTAMEYSLAATALPQPNTALSQLAAAASSPPTATTKTYDIVDDWVCHRVKLMFPLLYQADLSCYSVVTQMEIRRGNVPVGINATQLVIVYDKSFKFQRRKHPNDGDDAGGNMALSSYSTSL